MLIFNVNFLVGGCFHKVFFKTFIVSSSSSTLEAIELLTPFQVCAYDFFFSFQNFLFTFNFH